MMADDEGEDTNQEGIPSHPSEASERDLLSGPKAEGVRGLKREAETRNERRDDGARPKRRKTEANHVWAGLWNSEDREAGRERDGGHVGAGRVVGRRTTRGGSSRFPYRHGSTDRLQDRMNRQRTGPETGRHPRGGGQRDHYTTRRSENRTTDNARYRRTRDQYTKKQHIFRPISSELLSKTLDKEPSEAATELGSLKGYLQAGLNDELMEEGRQHLFWKALAFSCGALGAEQTVIMLLTMVIDSKLFKQYLPSSLIKLRRQEVAKEEGQSILVQNIITVLHSMMQSLPSRASDLKLAATLISDAVTNLTGNDMWGDIIESVKSLRKDIEDIEKERETKRQMDRIAMNPPPDDFRKQDILPTVEELQAGHQPFLRPHLKRGLYADADHYLDVLFRLLKEDFIYPLRNGISEYMAFKKANPERRAKLQDVRIYEDAHYTTSVHNLSGASHLIAFKKLPRVRWNSTKRLMYGSLLILSSDDFKSYIFATVANRDVKDLERGCVAISLVDREDASCLLHKKYVMAESSVFFEAYRPVLLALQRMSGPRLPFSRYTLSMCHDVHAPAYLQNQLTSSGKQEEDDLETIPCGIDISPLLRSSALPATINVLNDGAWPDIDDVQLDHSQYEAVKTALTQEISIIQGPPGTGKTYIGLKIVETLVRNRKVWSSVENPSPILLVCFTNHALDQFLEGILKFLPSGIVRVGNRSKSKLLQTFNLKRIVHGRRGFIEGEYVGKRLYDVKKEVEAAKRRVERTQARIEGARNGIINEYELGPFMSWQHYDSLLRLCHIQVQKSWLVEWLLCEHQYDRDWNQHDIYQKKEEEEEEEEGTSLDLGSNEATIEVEYERGAIESERMIDEEYEAEESDEEEDEDNPFLGLDLNEKDRTQHGTLRRFIQRKMSGNDVLDPRVLQSITDVWSMHPNDRWALYHIWLGNYLAQLKKKLPAYELKFKQLCGELDEAKDIQKLHVLQQATVIGMTTTGAANNQTVLQRVCPKIVVVEEAAEVLEAHIITALNASCEQLILIGDHQQLKPKPNVYLLAKKYHLDVSMFERLINNEFPYAQLEIQHRMRTELSALMRGHFYNNLHDHKSVTKYENIKSVEKNIFFLDHNEPEDEMEDTQSHYNLHEAEIVVNLCQYLLHQGYKPSQVTILTAYTGQLMKINQSINQLMGRSQFDGVKVTSIDNYQGEENDIVIVSFVRSNSHGRIGFVGISNRVCVSLSRAKKGLYCIGNFTLFAEKNDLWKGIFKDLKSTRSIGDSLTLQCTNHPEHKTEVKTADDFKKVPLGGCSRGCDTRLDCGHVCRLKCHPKDPNHEVYKCKAPCSKVICKKNHKCPRMCSELCPTSCSVTVEKLLPCDHKCKTKCKTDVWSIRCEEKVEKILTCSHVRLLPCHMRTEGFEKRCEVIINKELQCGHRKTEKCNGSGRCDEITKKVLQCTHTILAECHKDPKNMRCKLNVKTNLPCGHTRTLRCSTSIDDILCNEMIEKTLLCGHKLRMKCSTDLKTVVCMERCSKELACGHTCKETCGEDCTENCTEMISRDDWPCGHKVTVRCCDERDSCYIACEGILICGHRCKGTCGKCLQGRHHIPCSRTCRKKLVCGHECALKCGEPCRPCNKIRRQVCRHSQCIRRCSEPSDLCTKRCKWKCDHYQCKKLCCEPCDRPPCNKPCPKKRQCGHPCIGLCGEICPNECRICDKEDLKQRFFGTEDPEKARYIQLEDCDHFFEVDGLDKHLGFRIPDETTSQAFTKLQAKSCPRCEKPLQSSRRYGNLLKESCKTKQQIVVKLRREERKTSPLLDDVKSAIREARQTLHFRSHQRTRQSREPAYIPSTTFAWDSTQDSVPEEVYELLQVSTTELERHSQTSPYGLVDQQTFDITLSKMNRLHIILDLIEFQKSPERAHYSLLYGTSEKDDLLKILSQDSNLREDPLKSANTLLNQMYASVGWQRCHYPRGGSELYTFHSPTYLSYALATWFTCQRGHPVAEHQLNDGNCKECDREKEEQERDRSEASTSEGVASPWTRLSAPGQQNHKGNDRGRGRIRGRRRWVRTTCGSYLHEQDIIYTTN